MAMRMPRFEVFSSAIVIEFWQLEAAHGPTRVEGRQVQVRRKNEAIVSSKKAIHHCFVIAILACVGNNVG